MTPTLSGAVVRERVAKSLELLTQPAAEQRAWLEQRGTPSSADELALPLGECMVLVRMTVREGALSEAQATAVRRVHERLVALESPEHAALWQVERLDSAHEWSEIRRLAQAALELLRDPPPNG